MNMEQIQQRVEQIAGKVLEARGADLIEVRVVGHLRDVQVQITADKPLGGITIDECAILNKALVAAIEQDDFLPPDVFSLELGSPGLDRPLVTRKDFMRCMDRELCFWLNEPVAEKKEWQGTLAGITENSLTIKVKGAELELPLPLIVKGKLVI